MIAKVFLNDSDKLSDYFELQHAKLGNINVCVQADDIVNDSLVNLEVHFTDENFSPIEKVEFDYELFSEIEDMAFEVLSEEKTRKNHPTPDY